jgi:hypothetical protein
MCEPFLVVDSPVESTTIVSGSSLTLSPMRSTYSGFFFRIIASTLLLIWVKCISLTRARYSESASVMPSITLYGAFNPTLKKERNSMYESGNSYGLPFFSAFIPSSSPLQSAANPRSKRTLPLSTRESL